MRALAQEGVEMHHLSAILTDGIPSEKEFLACLVANLSASAEGYQTLRSWTGLDDVLQGVFHSVNQPALQDAPHIPGISQSSFGKPSAL